MSIPDIYDSFKGKSVFFTGVTGFVGKVFLYKILKEFPDIGTIYCLCRSKKGVSMEDRFAKGVLSSPCFFPLIKEIGEEEWKRRSGKCKAVAGDITHHRLGINNKDYDEMCENVNVIVHLAATVDFQEKLNLSCEMNVLGSVRVMSLAHKCRRLESYIHTSTCYVNHNRHGATPVKEQLYPLPFDPEAMLKFVLSLGPDQLASETKRLLKQYNYPNTYTFTKSITEHILMKQRGNLPLVIVRPAIIGCAWKEPYNGWVDALTAAGGLFLVTGLGVMHELCGNDSFKADIVPVDHVVNLLLKVTHRTILYHKPTSYGDVAESVGVLAQSSFSPQVSAGTIVAANDKNVASGGAAAVATFRRQPISSSSNNLVGGGGGGTDSSDPGALSGKFPRVYHSSTSATMNPLVWKTTILALHDFWGKLKHPKALSKPDLTLYPNPMVWSAVFHAKRVYPVKALIYAREKVPGFQNKKQVALLHRYIKATDKVADLNMQFSPFTSYEWLFETVHAGENLEDGCLSKAAQKAFSTDVFEINWFSYVQSYSWGLIKFIMKDDSVKQPTMPVSGAQQVFRASL